MKRGAGIVLFLVVTLSSVPSVPSVPEVSPARPSAAEVAQLEALSQWVAGERGFHAIAAEYRERALENSPPAVDLFAAQREEEASRRLLERLPYGTAIGQAAERYRVDGLLLAALVEAESSFDPRSLSGRGAMGLMQIMPVVAEGVEDPFDPHTNLDLGARYFSRLLHRFDGDLELAIAAYNAGPSAVERFGGVPPYRETSRFVSRVLGIYADHSRGVQAAPGPAAAPALAGTVLASR
jgi:soluble lytic murein transglycosylase-like protein